MQITEQIQNLRSQANGTLDYAETKVKGLPRATLIRDRLSHFGYCGCYLLAIVTRSGIVHIGDADDWEIERQCGSVEKAEKLFDQLFANEDVEYTSEFENKLKAYGFCGPSEFF